ncbi:hypothetical protein PIIN_11822 [Serendipita indica DSM 11827]|uniref:Uncharacterized protein n=1 Tax=Serendipita indica (strain DSM 11827) TaxID=1109443 RepID=G4U110_SERID|nr:hypothetical protein PIIN_11822 [Serendipita indica DSM 11827]
MDMEIDRDAEGREENYYKDPERRMRAIALLAQIKRHNEEIVKAFRKWDGGSMTNHIDKSVSLRPDYGTGSSVIRSSCSRLFKLV